MKIIAISAAALAITVTAAQADTYKGRIKWVGMNDPARETECVDGPNLGERDNATFHEYKDKSGERFTQINVFWTYGVDGKRVNGNVGATLTDVTSAESIGEQPYDPSTDPNSTQKISITSKTKANGTIVMEGQIQNPWGDPSLNDCIVDYLFTGVKS